MLLLQRSAPVEHVVVQVVLLRLCTRSLPSSLLLLPEQAAVQAADAAAATQGSSLYQRCAAHACIVQQGIAQRKLVQACRRNCPAAAAAATNPRRAIDRPPTRAATMM